MDTPLLPKEASLCRQLQSGEAHMSQLAVAASFASLEKGEKQDMGFGCPVNEKQNVWGSTISIHFGTRVNGTKNSNLRSGALIMTHTH